MPFDGIFTYAVCRELSAALVGGRVDKVYQPEPEELVLTFRKDGSSKRLLLSACPDSARLQLSFSKPETPLQPPAFCMLIRKHFEDAKLLSVTQLGFDRIVRLDFEKMNEIGDLTRRSLVLEMMGKHSNLILVREDGRVLDAVRHVNPLMSSVRTMQPGVIYELPSHNHKADPLTVGTGEDFARLLCAETGPLGRALYAAFNGFCPQSSREVLCRAGIDERREVSELCREELDSLYAAFRSFLRELTEEPPRFTLYKEEGKITDYSVFPYTSMTGAETVAYPDAGTLLDAYFAGRTRITKLQQKAGDLSRLLGTNLDRARRKKALQEEQLLDSLDREDEKKLGDLITSNLYLLKEGMGRVTVTDYYADPPAEVEITLDRRLSPSENAQRHYDRYNKKKRTEGSVSVQLKETEAEIEYLESLLHALTLAECEADLENVRLELAEAGYLKSPGKKKKNLQASRPLSFRTSEGIEVLVGKNNLQNDLLTFKLSDPLDLWFHVKDAPGSHCVLRVAGLEKGLGYTEASIAEAARLCAAHSSLASAGGGKCAVDYTLRRYVKKPAGSRPGFVTYTHQSTVIAEAAAASEAAAGSAER